MSQGFYPPLKILEDSEWVEEGEEGGEGEEGEEGEEGGVFGGSRSTPFFFPFSFRAARLCIFSSLSHTKTSTIVCKF